MREEQARVDSIEEKIVAMARAEAKVRSDGMKQPLRRALQFGNLAKGKEKVLNGGSKEIDNYGESSKHIEFSSAVNRSYIHEDLTLDQ